MSRELQVLIEASSKVVGRIVLGDDGTVTADGETAEGIFGQFRRRLSSDEETFDLLASGWSNGYVTIPALSAA